MMELARLPELAGLVVIALARIGALVMLLPGLGERAIPARQRIVLALAICVMVLPQIREALESDPDSDLMRILFAEMAIGLAIGTCGRLILSAMETAGSLIAQNVGLSFAQTIDPMQGQQSEILTAFFRMAGVTFIFAADLHHLAIAGIVGSYETLPVGAAFRIDDALTLFVRLVGDTFRAGVGIAAPFIVFGFVFNIGLGLAAMLAPQVQLFFLAIPVSIVLGVAVLGLVIGSIDVRFTEMARAVLANILPVH